MERKAEQTNQQKGLVKRYLKAENAHLVGSTEINLMWRIGQSATQKQIKTIEAHTPKTIQATSKAIEEKTTNFLESYAQSLITRNGGQGND